MKFKIIIDNIKACDGSMINIIYDNKPVLNEFLECIKNKLKTEYNIIDEMDETKTRYNSEDLNIILEKRKKGKNIIIINQILNNTQEIRAMNELYYNSLDKDLIIIILNNYYTTTNTQLSNGTQYASSLAMLLKGKKVKILKSRFAKNYELYDISSLIRRVKLKTLNEI